MESRINRQFYANRRSLSNYYITIISKSNVSRIHLLRRRLYDPEATLLKHIVMPWSSWARVASICRGSYARISLLATLLSFGILCLFWPFLSSIQRPDVVIVPNVQPAKGFSGEVYMTLLAPSFPHPWDQRGIDPYFETVTIMAHRLLHNAFTRDPLGRAFVVVATRDIKQKQISLLEELGATVRVVDSIPPPVGIDMADVYVRWKDQYTKLLLWNMTEYSRIVYIDADALIIKPIDELFSIPTQFTEAGEEWLFASVYDAAPIKGFGTYPNPLPELGPDDKWGYHEFSGGQFVLMPTPSQIRYIWSMYHDPPWGVDFKSTMEQAFLRYAYRDDGPYPWIRLSQIYNTQWPRAVDMAASKVIHEKSWVGGPFHIPELADEWHRGWGDVQGYLARTQGLEVYAQEPHPIAHG